MSRSAGPRADARSFEELWEQTLEVYRLQNGAWMLVRSLGGDARARIEPFDAVELDLTLVWGPVHDEGVDR
jgi:hypothetical protein